MTTRKTFPPGGKKVTGSERERKIENQQASWTSLPREERSKKRELKKRVWGGKARKKNTSKTKEMELWRRTKRFIKTRPFLGRGRMQRTEREFGGRSSGAPRTRGNEKATHKITRQGAKQQATVKRAKVGEPQVVGGVEEGNIYRFPSWSMQKERLKVRASERGG